MGVKQFLNTTKLIINSKSVNTIWGISRHMIWQLRRIFNLFPFYLKFSNSYIEVPNSHHGVAALINCMNLYDYNNMQLIKYLSSSPSIWFDVGANIGSYTLLISESPLAKVYSFEPHPKTFELLEKNVKINNRKNVILNNIALSNYKGKIGFTDYLDSSINSINKVAGQIEVNATTGEEFCKINNVIPDYIKIDVEGFEYDVLIGFNELIKKIKMLFVEMNSFENERSATEIETIKLLNDNHFLGPFYYNHTKKQFSKTKNNEDAIFISKTFLDTGYFNKHFYFVL